MKKTRSKFFAAALAATTMAAFYAAPVMAVQTGLTVKDDAIVAANSVTINGVTLSGNGLTAASDAFAVSRAGAVTGKGFTSNNGAIMIKDSNGTTVFTATTTGAVTAQGRLTANSGSAITATTEGRYQSASNVAANQISNTVKNYDNDSSSFVNGTSSVINGTTITDTVYDASGRKASSLALKRTSITGTVIGDNNANSTITLEKTSASLKSGKKGFTVNEQGVITIAGTNFNVAAAGAVTGKGFTSNNGAITIKDSNGTTVFNATAAGAVTTSGKLTANGGSAITATKENAKATSNVAYSAITDTVTNGTATATAKKTATAITDEVKLVDGNATIKTSIDKNGITDTFTDANNSTHKVTTNAAGTTFTGDTTDNRYNYSTIDGQKATFGGSNTNKTVIDGSTATFTGTGRDNTTTISGGSVATKTLTIDDKNKWDEDGLTVGGTTLATDRNGDLIVSGLDVENVYLQSDGFKLGETGQESFTVNTATGDVTTKGSIAADGGITAASYNGVEITTADSKVTVGGVDITTMHGDVATLRTDANTLRDDVNTLRTDASTLRTDTDTLRSDVNTMNGTLNTVSGDVGTLRNDVNTLRTDADTLRSDVTMLDSKTKGITRSGETTTIEGNTAVSSDGIVVSNESGVSTKTKADGYYVKDADGNNVAQLTADTVKVGGENVITATDKVRVNADVYKIDGENLAWKDGNGNVNIAADRGSFGVTDGANTVVKGDGVYIKDGTTVTTSLEKGELNLGANTLSDTQLGYINGMVTGAGTLANVTSINGAAVEGVDATDEEGSAAGLKIAGVTLQDGDISAKAITADTYNGVSIEKNSDSGNVTVGGVDITQAGTDISELQQKTGGIVRRTSGEFSTTEIEGAVGVNNKSGFYVLGEGKTIQDEDGKVASISRTGDMSLAGSIRAEGNASIAGTFITENDKGKATLSSSALNLSNGSENTVLVRNDGIARFGALSGANVRMEKGVLTVNSEGTDGKTKLSTAGLELTNAKLTTAGLEVSDKFDVDSTTGNITARYTENGTLTANDAGFAVKYGYSEFKVDSNGAAFTNGANNGTTTINGGTITTGTTTITGDSITTGTTTITGDSITTDTLNVDKIVLGDTIFDEATGKEFGNLNIGADGSVKLVDSEGTTTFEATTSKFTTKYGGYDLSMDATNGFSLGYTDGTKLTLLTLTEAGYAFSGALNLGNSTDVSFVHNSKSMTLSDLLGRVETLEQKTQGISYNDETGSTTISNGDSKLSVDKDGTNFTNGELGGTTNINGGVINADRSEIGNMAPGASGSGSGEMTVKGVVSDADAHQGSFEKTVDGVQSSFNFIANADGYVSEAKRTENGVEYISNVQNKADINSVSMTDGSSSSQREQTAASITNSVTAGDKSNSLAQTADSTVSSVTDGTNTNKLTQTAAATTGKVTDGTNTNTLTQNATETTNSVSDGTNNYSSSQTASGSVTKVSDGTNSSTFEQTASGHVITTTGEDGKTHSAVITGSDVVINQGTEDEVSLARTESRVTDLEGDVADLNRRVDKLDDRIDKVGAMAAAIANLRTMGYDPTAPTEFAVGIGQYRSDTGVALGLFHYPNRDFMLSLSVSTSGDEVMGGIGATWKFGRKKQPADQAKVNKAEELKLAAQKKK